MQISIVKEKIYDDFVTLIENVFTLDEFIKIAFNKNPKAALDLISQWGFDQKQWKQFIIEEYNLIPIQEKD
jgi:hypothetical protein